MVISDVKGGRHGCVVTEVKRTKRAGRKAYSAVDWREAGCGLVETLGSSGRQCTGPTTPPYSRRGHYSSPHPPPPTNPQKVSIKKKTQNSSLHNPSCSAATGSFGASASTLSLSLSLGTTVKMGPGVSGGTVTIGCLYYKREYIGSADKPDPTSVVQQ